MFVTLPFLVLLVGSVFSAVQLQSGQVIKSVQLNKAEIESFQNEFVQAAVSATATNTVSGLKIFFTPALSYSEAIKFCAQNNAQLAAITESNISLFSAFLSQVQVSPAYVASWDGNNFGNAGLALFSVNDAGLGTVSIPAGAPALALPGICLILGQRNE